MTVIVLLLASPFLLLSSHSKLCTAAKVMLLKLKLDHVPLFTQNPLMTCPFTQSKSWSPYNHLGWPHGFFSLHPSAIFKCQLHSWAFADHVIKNYKRSPEYWHCSFLTNIFVSKERTTTFHNIILSIYFLLSVFSFNKRWTQCSGPFPFSFFFPCCNFST